MRKLKPNLKSKRYKMRTKNHSSLNRNLFQKRRCMFSTKMDKIIRMYAHPVNLR